jgi:chaperonin cofactor prefoldin
MSQEEFQKQVLESLADLKTDVERLDASIEKSDDKFDTYRQATQSLVNLAFGLIASATVITVVSAVFKR